MSTGPLVGRAKQIRTLIFFLQHICTCIASLALSEMSKCVFNTDIPQKPFSLLAPQPLLLLCWAITLSWFVLTSEKLRAPWGNSHPGASRTPCKNFLNKSHVLPLALGFSCPGQKCVLGMGTSPVRVSLASGFLSRRRAQNLGFILCSCGSCWVFHGRSASS